MPGFDYGKYFGAIIPLADATRDSPTRFWEPTRQERSQAHDYVLYLGCNVLRTVNLAESIVAVLRAMGVSFLPMGGPAHCCGIQHHRYGDDAVSARLTQHTMNDFMGVRPEKGVLMYCPSCHTHFDGRLETGNFRFELPYQHVTQYLAEHLDRITVVNPIERRVALHYHTGGPQQRIDGEHTAAILRAIPGLDVVELAGVAHWGRHCSPQQAEDMGQKRFDDCVDGMFALAREQGCDTLATVYHSCYRELLPQEPRRGVEVLNYIELLAAAMGLGPFEARFKDHKLAQNPEAALAALEPRGKANGANLSRLRDSVRTHFSPMEAPAKASQPEDAG